MKESSNKSHRGKKKRASVKEVEKALVGKDVCIIGQKFLSNEEVKNAYKVRDDYFIRAIRKAKQFFGVAEMNRLFVCKNHYPEWKKKRKDFEGKTLIFGMVALVVFFLMGILPIFLGKLNLSTFVSSLFLSFILVLIPVLFKYVPSIED